MYIFGVKRADAAARRTLTLKNDERHSQRTKNEEKKITEISNEKSQSQHLLSIDLQSHLFFFSSEICLFFVYSFLLPTQLQKIVHQSGIGDVYFW